MLSFEELKDETKKELKEADKSGNPDYKQAHALVGIGWAILALAEALDNKK